MRKKERLKKLKCYLQRIIQIKERSRIKRPKFESKYNLCFQQIGKQNKVEYGTDKAVLIARFMEQINDKIRNAGKSFIQQYYITKGLKLFGERGKEAAQEELEQLVERVCWEPTHVEDMTDLERQQAQDAMMLLAEKNTGEIKGRCVFKETEQENGWGKQKHQVQQRRWNQYS